MTEPADTDDNFDDPSQSGPVLYREIGSSWWPVVWGPLFALIGGGVEATTGPVHVLDWVLVGLALGGLAALWAQARRRFWSVTLTPLTLRQGRETLSVQRIAEVDEVNQPVGARVLGGGWTVPKKLGELPVKLTDDSIVVAWARDPEALRAALRPLIQP
ncbi:MAG TPA: hypothetical protein VG317_04825 [Pseudonocardiaceae bacterium]|jgi:hypothetical protein|nr:hypothetical protein [Pseudonocardiaceae bacterium]